MPAVEGGKVCIIGAGGSMGASIIGALSERYTLRLTDAVSEEQARARPLMWGAPPHPRLGPPHEWLRVNAFGTWNALRAALYPRGAATNPARGGRALAVRAVVAWEELGAAFLARLRSPRVPRCRYGDCYRPVFAALTTTKPP
ncbi:MAG: hypothetical protein ACOC2D_13765, partial [Spirochaetota bacterium]